MSKNVSTVLAFIVGAGVGAGGAYIYAKKKYESLIDSEVNSARETYQRLAKELADKNEEEKKKLFTEYTEKVENYISDIVSEENDLLIINKPVEEYVNEEEENIVVKEVKPDDISTRSTMFVDSNTPYEIDASEYGSNEDYDLKTLTYYSNEVFTDDEDDVITDVAVIIGKNLIDKLSIYENNGIYTAYARNDTRRCDYEIILAGYDYN